MFRGAIDLWCDHLGCATATCICHMKLYSDITKMIETSFSGGGGGGGGTNLEWGEGEGHSNSFRPEFFFVKAW